MCLSLSAHFLCALYVYHGKYMSRQVVIWHILICCGLLYANTFRHAVNRELFKKLLPLISHKDNVHLNNFLAAMNIVKNSFNGWM